MSVPEGRVPAAAIVGAAGPALTADERKLFADANPLGFILFSRNCETPDQLRGLVSEMRAAVARADAPVLIDQEGGRVARLGPPGWRRPPPARAFVDLVPQGFSIAVRAARLNARMIGRDLARLGITVDCAPVCDIPVPGAHDIIGDRAYGETPDTVVSLARAVCDGLLDEGVSPVIKHMPGHGRARVDSHVALPVVEVSLDTLRHTDFAPFRALHDMPWAMTAHVVFSALDRELPASASPTVIHTVIRGELGFNGVLASDDVGMAALAGSMAERTQAVLAAGCDVALHCSGELKETDSILAVAPPLSEAARARLRRAEAKRLAAPARAEPIDDAALADALQGLLGGVAA